MTISTSFKLQSGNFDTLFLSFTFFFFLSFFFISSFRRRLSFYYYFFPSTFFLPSCFLICSNQGIKMVARIPNWNYIFQGLFDFKQNKKNEKIGRAHV